MALADYPRPSPIEIVCKHRKYHDSGFLVEESQDSSQQILLTQVLEDALSRQKRNLVDTEIFKRSISNEEEALTPSRTQRKQFSLLKRKKGFSVIHNRLRELYEDSSEYDDEFLRPTKYAGFTAIGILVAAGSRLRGPFPKAWVSTDGQGGLSFEWRISEKKVVLFVPAKRGEKIRILYKSDSDRGVVAASPVELARWLKWLTETEWIHA